jgi:hypothetical protein
MSKTEIKKAGKGIEMAQAKIDAAKAILAAIETHLEGFDDDARAEIMEMVTEV